MGCRAAPFGTAYDPPRHFERGEPRCDVESNLPTLAGNNPNSRCPATMRVDAEDVDVGGNGVVLGGEVGVCSPRPELYVMASKVAPGLQVVVDDLFEDVFFHAPRCGLTDRA